MRKIVLLLLVVLAVRMAGRAVKRNSEVIALLWVLIGMTASVSTAGTAKSRSTEDRLNGLIPKVFPNTGGTVTGSMTVNGNHFVGGSLFGGSGSGSTLTVGSPTHVSGAGMTVDNGLTSHANVAADGNVTAGGNMSVSGNHTVGGQLLGSGGGTLTVGSPTHFSGSGLTTDNTITSHGAVNADGNVAAGGDVNASGWLRGTDLSVNGQRIAPGQGRPAFYPAAVADNVPTHGILTALNEIVSCLIAAGISA